MTRTLLTGAVIIVACVLAMDVVFIWARSRRRRLARIPRTSVDRRPD